MGGSWANKSKVEPRSVPFFLPKPCCLDLMQNKDWATGDPDYGQVMTGNDFRFNLFRPLAVRMPDYEAAIPFLSIYLREEARTRMFIPARFRTGKKYKQPRRPSIRKRLHEGNICIMGYCYGLNVCAPPPLPPTKFTSWSPGPQCDDIRSRASGRN